MTRDKGRIQVEEFLHKATRRNKDKETGQSRLGYSVFFVNLCVSLWRSFFLKAKEVGKWKTKYGCVSRPAPSPHRPAPASSSLALPILISFARLVRNPLVQYLAQRFGQVD